MPDWIGEFYAYYQWFYNMPSSEIVKKISVNFLKKAYYGLHDLDLELAVKKVGEVQWKSCVSITRMKKFQNTLTDRYNKYIAVTSQRSGQPGVNAQGNAENIFAYYPGTGK